MADFIFPNLFNNINSSLKRDLQRGNATAQMQNNPKKTANDNQQASSVVGGFANDLKSKVTNYSAHAWSSSMR